MARHAPTKYLSKAQWAALLAVVDSPRDMALLLVAYWSALRATEIGMIQVSDVDLVDDKITIRRLKGSHGGDLQMSPNEVKAVKAWLKIRSSEPGPLFPGRAGKGLDRRSVWVLLQKYGKRAGIPAELVHPHALKHSRAVHFLEEGRDIADVKDWLGHVDIRNTTIYAQITNKRRQETATAAFAAERPITKARKKPAQKKPVLPPPKDAHAWPIIEE